MPNDNNWLENRIRPIATGRKNWLLAGSLRAGKRAAAIMSLTQSAKLNRHDPFLYLKDIRHACRLSLTASSASYCRIAGNLNTPPEPEINLGLPGAYDSPTALLERADRALYAAKNCVKIATADRDDQAGQAPS